MYLEERELREKFNTLIQPNIDRGLYVVNTVRKNPPSSDYGQPPGTISVFVEVVDRQGNHMAFAHAYLLPDGRFGASGRLDPKQVKVDGIFYKKKH